MRILSIGARGVPNVEGGAEKNAEKIFPRIALRHSVTLLCLRTHCAVSSYQGVTIIRTPEARLFGTDKIFYYLASLYHASRLRPDIIHCQGLNAAIFLLFYKLAARRVVVRYGSADYLNAKWGLIGRAGFRLCEWQLRFADAVIAVTPSLRERLAQRGVTRGIEVIPNALDPVEANPSRAALDRLGLTADGFVLSVGRITWQKDYATLIAAHAKARQRAPGLGPLVIVGGDDGSGYRQRLQAEAGDSVIFAGRLARDEIYALYAACQLYVNSSLHEGLSNAILEAISLGAPLVVSDIVENRDLPLAARQFFRAGDAQDLAARILEAVTQPDVFRADRARFMDWDSIADATMALYDHIMAPEQG